MSTAGAVTATGGAQARGNGGAGSSRTQQQSLTSQKGHPQQKNKRNRSRRKRGKAGGDGADGGGAVYEGTSATGADSSSAIVQSSHTQRPKKWDQLPKRQQYRDRQCMVGQPPNGKLLMPASSSAVPSCVTGNAAVATARAVISTMTEFKGSRDDEPSAKLEISHEEDSAGGGDDCHALESSSREGEEKFEDIGPQDRSLTDSNFKVEPRTATESTQMPGKASIVIDKGVKGSTDLSPRDIAPFECSWTTAPSSGNTEDHPTSARQGIWISRATAGPEIHTRAKVDKSHRSSKGSYESSQEGKNPDFGSKPESLEAAVLSATNSSSPSATLQPCKTEIFSAVQAHHTEGGDGLVDQAGVGCARAAVPCMNPSVPAASDLPENDGRLTGRNAESGSTVTNKGQGDNCGAADVSRGTEPEMVPKIAVRSSTYQDRTAREQNVQPDEGSGVGRAGGNSTLETENDGMRSEKGDGAAAWPNVSKQQELAGGEAGEHERSFGYKDHGKNDGVESVKRQALASGASSLPPRQSAKEQRRVRFAADCPQEDRERAAGGSARVSGCGDEEEGGEDDALLPPDLSASEDLKIERDGVGGGGGRSVGQCEDAHLKGTLEVIDLGDEAMTDSALQDLMLDDIDDELSSLLDGTPATTAIRTGSKSRPPVTLAPKAPAETAAASFDAPSSLKAPLPATSSARSQSSSPAVTARRGGSKPRAGPRAGPTSASAQAEKAASATFNYCTLPALPEKAPEGKEGQPSGRTSSASDGLVAEPQQRSPFCATAPLSPQETAIKRPSEKAMQAASGDIWEAVRRGDAAGVRAKLAAGATLDEADSEGRTPLMVACAAGDVDMAALLVNGVSPPSSVAARTIEGWTPLMISSGGGRLGVVEILLQAGAALHDKDDEFGSNSFMWACGGGHTDVVRLMLDNGAKELLESVNSDMWTPLMIACDAGRLETVQILVEAGADLTAFNRDVLTALDIAAGRNHFLIECYLRTEGAFGAGHFWAAADSGDAETIARLLRNNGHLVAALDPNGRTALLRSCVGGHLDVAKALVEAGTEVDFQDSSGTSALSVSVVLGNMALTRYLVQVGGARLTLKNNAGWTPLMQAVAKGDLVMTRMPKISHIAKALVLNIPQEGYLYLVDRGAAVNDGSPGGDSVLDMAMRFSGAELQRYLAAKGGFSSHEVKRQIEEVNNGCRGLFRFW